MNPAVTLIIINIIGSVAFIIFRPLAKATRKEPDRDKHLWLVLVNLLVFAVLFGALAVDGTVAGEYLYAHVISSWL